MHKLAALQHGIVAAIADEFFRGLIFIQLSLQNMVAESVLVRKRRICECVGIYPVPKIVMAPKKERCAQFIEQQIKRYPGVQGAANTAWHAQKHRRLVPVCSSSRSTFNEIICSYII